jgi:radical SAM protein with 4Fe4S-binding SPASM domain
MYYLIPAGAVGQIYYKMSSLLAFPKWIILQLVERCNLRCHYCYQWGDSGSYHEKERLKVLDYTAIEKIVHDGAGHKLTFALFGGEPFLHPKVFSIIKLIKQSGSFVYVNTNGTMLEHHAEELIDTPPDRVWVSLDGPPEINDMQRGKGVFEKVKKGIAKLHRLKQERQTNSPELGIDITVSTANWSSLEDFVFNHVNMEALEGINFNFQNFLLKEDHLKYAAILRDEFGVEGNAPIAQGIVQDPGIFDTIDIPLLTRQLRRIKEHCEAIGVNCNIAPKTVSEKNFTNYFSGKWDQIDDKRSSCSFPFLQAEINARGDVVTCHTFYDHTLGNIYDSSLKEIWNGEKMKKFRKYIHKQLLPICSSCCSYYYNSNGEY